MKREEGRTSLSGDDHLNEERTRNEPDLNLDLKTKEPTCTLRGT